MPAPGLQARGQEPGRTGRDDNVRRSRGIDSRQEFSLEILPLGSALLDEVRPGYGLLEVGGERKPALAGSLRGAGALQGGPGVLYPDSQAFLGFRCGVGGDHVQTRP